MNEGRVTRRVQRSRRKGDRTPPGTIYCGRGTYRANPFRSDRFGHVRACRLHRQWLDGHLSYRALRKLGFGDAEIAALWRLRKRVIQTMHELAGHDLQCWCPVTSRFCHVDTLVERASWFEGLEEIAA